MNSLFFFWEIETVTLLTSLPNYLASHYSQERSARALQLPRSLFYVPNWLMISCFTHLHVLFGNAAMRHEDVDGGGVCRKGGVNNAHGPWVPSRATDQILALSAARWLRPRSQAAMTVNGYWDLSTWHRRISLLTLLIGKCVVVVCSIEKGSGGFNNATPHCVLIKAFYSNTMHFFCVPKLAFLFCLRIKP